jgi:bifunctional polynucleotide phosphatase/kinase
MILIPDKVSKAKRLAMFDFDGTMVKPKNGRRFPKDRSDWEWWSPHVPDVIHDYVRRRFRIVLVTDQSKPWKIEMIRDVLEVLGVSATVVIGTEPETKKPHIGQFLSAIPESSFDKTKSFFVGDAAGRPGDWADTDRRFAEAIGVRFYTPEELFRGGEIERPPPPHLDTQMWAKQHVLVMVGFPGSGKSTWAHAFAEQHPTTVSRIEGDTYKTAAAMVRAARNIHKAHPEHTLVMDATNGTRERRAAYIEFAKTIGFPVICIWVTTDLKTSLARAQARTTAPKVPAVALYRYQKVFEAPTQDECTVVSISA